MRDIHTGTVVVADADRDRYGAERSNGSGNQPIGVAERGTGRNRNTAYMTPMELKTAGGFLDANPLLRFKSYSHSEDVRFLINQLATNKEIYNTEIDIPGVTVDKPFLLNRGSVAFSVEPTRTTRLPVDWVHDSTNNRVLILLSNPERHIADLLVQYDINGDSYRVLHTFR